MGQIPEFEGRTVDSARLALRGSVDDYDGTVEVGEEVFLVVKGKVSGVAHKVNQFGVLRRVQSITLDHAIAADELTAQRIEQDLKRIRDEATGQTSMDSEIEQAIDGTAQA